jgi:DNA topoisomerase VI subunit B
MYKTRTTTKTIRLSTRTTLQSDETIYNYILDIDVNKNMYKQPNK